MIVKLVDLVSDEIIVYPGVKSILCEVDSQKQIFIVLRFRTKKCSFPAKKYYIYEVVK